MDGQSFTVTPSLLSSGSTLVSLCNCANGALVLAPILVQELGLCDKEYAMRVLVRVFSGPPPEALNDIRDG
eukprot:2394480-Amphidinium_carterae.1